MSIRTRFARILTVLPTALALLAAPAVPARASVFNPHFIISDSEIRNAETMSFSDIYGFLAAKGGLNSHFDVDAVDGLLKGTAQLIDDAAKRYRINPKYLLALLQKESGIIETKEPTVRQLDWAAGYALCDGCYRTGTLAQKYKGLAKQIDAGAGWMDWYLKNAQTLTYLKQPGVTYTISGMPVTPANLATAGLYNYTPHIHGNRLLWSIMRRWFGGGTSLQFPDGTLVRNEATGAVALIQNGRVRPILNESVLVSRFNAASAVDLNQYDFQALHESNPGRPVRFADLSLVRTEDGSTYLLIGASRRRIASPEVFTKVGFNPEEVEDIAFADIEEYSEGAPITMETAYPLGELLQNNATGGVYYVENGTKFPIWDRAILQANYGNRPIAPTAPAALDPLPTGAPVPFTDGALVKTPDSPAVYVISGGKRRSIPTEEVFLAFGYKWTNILTASVAALSLHPEGDPLLLLPPDEPVTAAIVSQE